LECLGEVKCIKKAKTKTPEHPLKSFEINLQKLFAKSFGDEVTKLLCYNACWKY
jgi:hypothetical protein